jgi:hypothetical protein
VGSVRLVREQRASTVTVELGKRDEQSWRSSIGRWLRTAVLARTPSTGRQRGLDRGWEKIPKVAQEGIWFCAILAVAG